MENGSCDLSESLYAGAAVSRLPQCTEYICKLEYNPASTSPPSRLEGIPVAFRGPPTHRPRLFFSSVLCHGQVLSAVVKKLSVLLKSEHSLHPRECFYID